MSGIYAGVVRKNGVTRVYIGSTARSFEKRWAEHEKLLRLGEHHAPGLQALADTYGLNAVKWEPLSYWDRSEGRKALLAKETFYIEMYAERYGPENVVNVRRRA